jgi:hypothetical protein
MMRREIDDFDTDGGPGDEYEVAKALVSQLRTRRLLERASEFRFESKSHGTMVVKKTTGDTPAFYAKDDETGLWFYRIDHDGDGRSVTYGFCKEGERFMDDHLFDTIDELLEALSKRVGELVL